MRLSTILTLVVLFCGAQSLTGQSSKQIRADKLFDGLAFSSSIPLYEELAEESDNPYFKIRLADASRLTDRFAEAEYWYSTLMQIDTLDAVYKLYYAQALMANEKYDQARGWFEAYAKAKPEDPRGAVLAESCKNIGTLLTQSFPAEILPLPINTARSEIGPAFYSDSQLLFASERDSILGVRRTNEWYDAPYLNLYTVDRDEDGLIGKAKIRAIKGNVNGPYHEGPGSLSGDNILYFTKSNLKSSDELEGQKNQRRGLVKLSIQKAIRSSSGDRWEWTDETALPFNSTEYSCAHPTLSADGLTMIFSSDMPGGYGGIDLYKTVLLADGSAWGNPENLGPTINTAGDEMFAFLHPDGNLYYASDGLPGLGGLDIFETRMDGRDWQLPRNMGKPINSSRDDFGLIFDLQLSTGFLVSNRFGGAGRDDIYGVKNIGIELGGTVYNAFSGSKISGATLRLRQAGTERARTNSASNGTYQFAVGTNRSYEVVVSAPGHLRKILPIDIGDLKFPSAVQLDVALEDTLLLKLVVQVVDKDSRTPLTDAKVMVYNKCTNVNTEIPADEEGILRVRLEPNCTFYIAGRKLGYLDDNDVVSTMGITESSEMATVLELTEIKEDLVIELKNIYYDYGRYYIREDAVGDLDNLSALLEQYPSLKIEISSHTDSRGSDEYNKGLSQKRAETCVDYLVTKGISKDRLVARGYGEYVLRNQCANGVNCTEEEHQVNRRTEFKVLSFDRVLYSDEVESPAVNLYKNAFGDNEKYLSRPALVEMGLAEPGVPLIVQKNAEENEDESQRTSSSLLDRQKEVSRAAAAGVSDEVPLPNKPLPKEVKQEPRKQSKPRKTVVLEPDNPVQNLPIAEKPKPVQENISAPKPAAPPIEQTTKQAAPVEVIPAAEQTEAKTNEWWKKGVSYSIQLGYGTTNTAAFSAYSDLGRIVAEKKPNGVPVIIVGYYSKYSEANSIQQVVRGRGLKDAFVVSYVDGQRLE